MKKKILLLLSLAIASVGLVGCGQKPVESIVATESFVDMYIYGKTSDEFKKAFSNSQQLEQEAADQKEEVKNKMNTTLSSGQATFTPEQAQKLTDEFAKAINEKTSYSAELAGSTDSEATVNVSVTGLDYSSDIKTFFPELFKELISNPTIVTDTAKSSEFIYNKMIDFIKEVSTVQEPQSVTLTLKVDPNNKSKWIMDPSNETALAEMQSLFYFGEKNQTTLSEKMENIVKDSLKLNK